MAKIIEKKSELAQRYTGKSSWLSSNGHNIYFIDLDSGESLGLAGLPTEHQYEPEASFAVIKSPGRNAPHYHYTGSEDTLTLEISWYADTEDKRDVIERCKWLESMTKADSYYGRPHLCRLMWGTMYSKTTWIVVSASYRTSNWDSTKGYVPTMARQTVVLKKVIKQNTTTEHINDWRT